MKSRKKWKWDGNSLNWSPILFCISEALSISHGATLSRLEPLLPPLPPLHLILNWVEEYMRVKCLLPKLCSIKCYAEKTTVRWILPFFGMLHKEKSWSERKQESKRPRTRQKNPRRPHNESDLYVNQPLQSIFDKTKSFYFGCILKVYEAKQMPNKTTDQKNSIKSTDRHLFGFICCFYAVGDDC